MRLVIIMLMALAVVGCRPKIVVKPLVKRMTRPKVRVRPRIHKMRKPTARRTIGRRVKKLAQEHGPAVLETGADIIKEEIQDDYRKPTNWPKRRPAPTRPRSFVRPSRTYGR